MKRAALVAAALALLGLPRAARAEDERSNGQFETYLVVGDTVGRQDYRYGLVNRNGYGGGLGVRFALLTDVGRKLQLGVWAGGESLGGPLTASLDTGEIYFTYRLELGLQGVVRLDQTTIIVRAAKYWFNDSAIKDDVFTGWFLRARADRGELSGELGYGRGDFQYVEGTLRWRMRPWKCPGITVERFDAINGLTSGTHVRLFYAIDF